MCNIATRSYYIGCLRAIGGTSDFGDPNRRQGIRRKIEIENLNGNIIELMLWDEMAKHFDQVNIKNMEQPVFIAVSSCRVSKYQDYQLSISSVTYYYLNPDIPKAVESRAVFKARYEDSPPLIICKLPYQDVQQEKIRNRFPLKTIMEQNPNSYKVVEKYKSTDPNKIPPEILAAQGKPGVFQFHLNTLEILKELTLDVVFDLKKQDESMGTPSSASAATTQSMEKQEETQRGKEKCTAEETTTPSHSAITDATKKKEETERAQGKSAKRALFNQQSTEPKKQKGD
ncbi:nucleic acid-binding, OB-fold protein [Tanacetum coccineum]